MKFTPTYDNILVLPSELATKVGSFTVPFGLNENHMTAIIVAAGVGRITDTGIAPLAVSVGQKVMFPKTAGVEVRIDGQKHLVIKEQDIMAIVED